MEIDQIRTAKKGDLVVLRDHNTLTQINSNLGEGEDVVDDFTTSIKSAIKWSHSGIEYVGWELNEFKIQLDEYQLMVLTRFVGDDDPEARVFILHDRTPLKNSNMNMIHSVPGGTGFTFIPGFSLERDGDNDDYAIKDPWPFFEVRRKDEDGTTILGICEYGLTNDNDGTYWAEHCFAEWFNRIGDDGCDGLFSLWFGYDVSWKTDVEVIRG